MSSDETDNVGVHKTGRAKWRTPRYSTAMNKPVPMLNVSRCTFDPGFTFTLGKGDDLDRKLNSVLANSVVPIQCIVVDETTRRVLVNEKALRHLNKVQKACQSAIESL